MRFFNPRISQDQFLSGLTSAATGIFIGVPVLLALLIAHNEHFQWRYVSTAFAILGITTLYVAVKIHRARRGTIALNPSVAFFMTSATVLTLLFGHLASYYWSGNVFLALLVLPIIFFAVIGDNQMLVAGWVVTAAAGTVCLLVEHLRSDVFWAQWVVYVSLYAVAGTMVAPLIRKLHNRFRSRDALSDLTKALATAESVETALAECIPLVHTVIPCQSATVYARGEGVLTPIAGWKRDDVRVVPPHPNDIPDEIAFATGAKLVGQRVYVPAGYVPEGELVLVIEEINTKKVTSFFAEEAASGLSSSLLLMTARLAYVSGLRHESRTDPLTGLANRRALGESLDRAIVTAGRSDSPLAVAMLDLDHFKQFNDTLGHAAGDELLSSLARTLSGRLRASDVMARYGGEEFCIILSDCALTPARALLEELRALARTVSVSERASTISIGVAQWSEGETAEELLLRADRALYAAKEGGRDRVVADDVQFTDAPSAR